MLINVYFQNNFNTSTIQVNEAGRYVLYNNDPAEAHGACTYVRFKSYHFIRGKLYKCGPVALFPEFDRQHKLDISDADRALINAYRPLVIEDWHTRGLQFLKTIDEVIPQCKFCPAKKDLYHQQIFAVRKGTNGTSIGYTR